MSASSDFRGTLVVGGCLALLATGAALWARNLGARSLICNGDENGEENRVHTVRTLITAQRLQEELPIDNSVRDLVNRTRQSVRNILDGSDDRLMVIVGPCSVHDPRAGLEYAKLLKQAADLLSDDLLIIMRVYFEKPRTTVGWKGLINDPYLDNSCDVNAGLRMAREFLLDVHRESVPAGTEFLDTVSPCYIQGLISWGAIGARTTESQNHRQMASGLGCPVGFKNGTTGDVQVAADACMSASKPHKFLSVSDDGGAVVVTTSGNTHPHLILRGGSAGPNYEREYVEAASEKCVKSKLQPGRIVVDCSHGNSSKKHERQLLVAQNIAEQIAVSSRTCSGRPPMVAGVMLESFLEEGNQKLPCPAISQEMDRGVLEGNRQKALGSIVFGKSITDACLSWSQTLPALELLAGAVRARRQNK